MNLVIDWVSKLLKNTVNYGQVRIDRRKIKRGGCLKKYPDITDVDIRQDQAALTFAKDL